MPTSERIAACLAAARALDEAIAGEIKPIPDGWFSRQMLQESIGVGSRVAKERIQAMRERGIVESQKWKTATGMVPIYRLKP
jgi:hypothetical protein